MLLKSQLKDCNESHSHFWSSLLYSLGLRMQVHHLTVLVSLDRSIHIHAILCLSTPTQGLGKFLFMTYSISKARRMLFILECSYLSSFLSDSFIVISCELFQSWEKCIEYHGKYYDLCIVIKLNVLLNLFQRSLKQWMDYRDTSILLAILSLSSFVMPNQSPLWTWHFLSSDLILDLPLVYNYNLSLNLEIENW